MYRIYTVTSLESDVKPCDWLAVERRHFLANWGCLGENVPAEKSGPIKVKNMILKQVLEEKREATAKAVEAFSEETAQV